ncbi:MAG: hypothetical protein Q9208_005321 [Pyrenodesmia sp. 3 TL-2023]
MAESTVGGPNIDEKPLPAKHASQQTEHLVGYLGAKQLPCSQQFPTFDIGPDCHRLRAQIRAVYTHSGSIYWLKVNLRGRANKVLTLDPATMPPGSKEFLIKYEATVRRLEEKAEAWDAEHEKLRYEIRHRIYKVGPEREDFGQGRDSRRSLDYLLIAGGSIR